MICPNCKGELSRVWQTNRSSQQPSIAQVRWGCGTCGETFTSRQLRPEKKELIPAPAQPELA